MLKMRESLFAGRVILICCLLVAYLYGSNCIANEVFTPEDVLKMKTCTAAKISPDGERVAYTVRVPRAVDVEAGGAYSELYLVSVETGESRPFITGKVNISSPEWSPDGTYIGFKTSRGEKAKAQVWIIPADGGEAWQATHSKTGVSSFHWHPSGEQIAYVATEPKTESEEKLEDKGYGFTTGGETVAAAISQQNLVDHRYMFQKIHLLDVATKKMRQLSDNPGKLGNYMFSPDGSKMAYTAALERKDHAVSQVYVMDIHGGQPTNLTPPDFRGHVHWVGWKDDKNIVYRSGEGAWPTLSLVRASGGDRKVLLHSLKADVIVGTPSYTEGFKHVAFVGSGPDIPGDVYYWKNGKEPKRLTTLNPWISGRQLGRQEVVRYEARDGLEIEGILIYPVNYTEGRRYPLIVVVHGGPEYHYSNGWMTSYSRGGQYLAGKGYAVFHPNYRASTGYGVEFALEGYEDAAGKEFDDIADGIEYLIEQGIADPERVGLGGGSYGGFAAAWFSSYYTKYVKAVCMFVGISDLISKRSTTDIPYEELYVHSGKKLEEMWEFSLQRSPIYWAHQSRTAVLIIGGAADTRVHPSQSLEYYRRLKMNDHPAVRLVQYPGEGHGNRKQPGRIDVLYRQLLWYDWYVRDNNPMDGPMPVLDISEFYGLELEN